MPVQPSLPETQPPSSPSFEKASLPTTYTNVFRASGSAEELILNFGLDAHRCTADGGEPAVMLQRLVLTYSHAKSLALMLRELVQLHENRLWRHIHSPRSPPTPPPTEPATVCVRRKPLSANFRLRCSEVTRAYPSHPPRRFARTLV